MYENEYEDECEQADLFEFGSQDPLIISVEEELKEKEAIELTIKKKVIRISKNLFSDKIMYEFETDEFHEPGSSIEKIFEKLKSNSLM
ncbi:hypothetical protein [Gottfriedia solisilvae]|uniref:hypothetical protein n=1 Tax=Gottfriedia solisilvae TaxID=1516104 RepID=UPI003D2EAC9C